MRDAENDSDDESCLGLWTYVVANRGTEPASFSMRSNEQTVAGGVLESGELSGGFEISFQSGVSQIEILNDGDCDPTNNSEWVESC